MQPAFVSAAKIAATLTPALRATDGVITITGIGDHLRPEWPITITGMRKRERFLSDDELARLADALEGTERKSHHRPSPRSDF